LEREITSLGQVARLPDVLLDLELIGVASLSDRVAMTALLDDRLAHELRFLDLDADRLTARPTDEDVARIDVQGALGGAVAALRAKSEAGGRDGQLAAAALQRLYVETLRHDAEVTQ
jgi:hypothetical protein